MKRTRILAALLAVLVMLVMAIALLPQQSATQEEEETKRNVVVAAMEISADTVLTEEMLTYAQFPESLIPEGAIESLEDAVGNITKSEVTPKEMLTRNKILISGDQSDGLAMLLDEGVRAMSVRVDEVSGVGYLLKVGNCVDVIVVFDDTVNETGYRSQMLLENVKVAALDTALVGTPVDANGIPQYTTVTLALLPQEAVSLALAFHEGSVYLIQRPQGDEGYADTEPIQIWDFVN